MYIAHILYMYMYIYNTCTCKIKIKTEKRVKVDKTTPHTQLVSGGALILCQLAPLLKVMTE